MILIGGLKDSQLSSKLSTDIMSKYAVNTKDANKWIKRSFSKLQAVWNTSIILPIINNIPRSKVNYSM